MAAATAAAVVMGDFIQADMDILQDMDTSTTLISTMDILTITTSSTIVVLEIEVGGDGAAAGVAAGVAAGDTLIITIPITIPTMITLLPQLIQILGIVIQSTMAIPMK